MRTGGVPFLDVFQPEFRFDSPDVLTAAEASWYAETPAGLLVLRHKEAWDLAKDPRFGHDGKRYMELHGITDGPLYDWFTNMLNQVGSDDHHRLRGLVTKALTPRQVNRLREFTASTAAKLAQRIRPGEPVEFVDAFALPLPVLVMREALGIVAEDYEWFRQSSGDIGLVFSSNLGAVAPRVEAAVVALSGYVDALVERRKVEPTDDFVTALVQAHQDGAHLTADELRNLLLTLIFAGQDQVMCQLTTAMAAFASHSEQWDLVANTPALAPNAADEVIRWCPSSHGLLRYAFEDVDYAGVHIPMGTLVLIANTAANRDPRTYSDPNTFDIARRRDAHQIAFGGGLYRCLGVMLARMEIAESLAALAARFNAPTVSGPVRWRPPGAIIFGADEMTLTFPPKTRHQGKSTVQ